MKSTSEDPALLVGLDAPDDAAVYVVAPGVAIVQTVDFFTPIVDDPRAWGRIAAANALSDVYAMGARPLIALNLIAWPRAVDFAILGRVLDGAGEACAEAGCAIVGGHSVDDPEPKYGLAVTGTVQPDAILRKTGATPGSELVLTKPLGLGIISSGIKEGKTTSSTAREAERVMSQLNKNAAEAALQVGVEACTDVTGYGLVGHLLQMLGEELDAELEFSAVPVLGEALDLAAEGVLPGGSKRNREVLEDKVDAGHLQDRERAVLFDAQTSGGLLLAVEPRRTATLVVALERAGVETRAVIGRLAEGAGRITIR